jgi:phospholipid/cholesterol/gamma-HCH transport system substrate-binding protein
MTAARGLAAGALLVVAVVAAVLLLRGGDLTEYQLNFQNAGQLVKGDDVQIGGRRVGNVKEIKLTNDNQARVTIELEEDFAPLHAGTTAIIRATSLSGIANRYIALTPGADNKPKLDDGAELTAASTTAPVDLDQLFNTLDAPTRKALQNVIQGSSTWYDNAGADANRGAKFFNPALSTSSTLINELVGDQKAFTDLVVNSSKVVSAIAERRDDLSKLVTNANTTTGAIAAENQALEQALGLLPGTLRQANTTFVDLRSTLDDLDVLVAESKPATKDLAPFFAQLRPLVNDARPTIRDLRQLIRRPGSNNDLIELLSKAPRLQKVAQPAFANSITALRKTTPVLDFIRPYAPELAGWIRDFGQTTANYDANGHFARVQPIFNAFNLNNNVLVPSTASARPYGLITKQFKRCPGAASQPAADGSAPFRDTDNDVDCDPSQVIPGP